MKSKYLPSVLFSILSLLLLVGCDQLSNETSTDAGAAAKDGSLLSAAKGELKKLSKSEEVEPVLSADQQIYDVMVVFMAEENEAAEVWMASCQTVLTPRTLNCELLYDNAPEYAAQRDIIQTYMENTEIYSAFGDSTVHRLRERLRPLEGMEEKIEEAVQEVEVDHLRQKPVFDSLMAAHITYGQTMLEILELLEKNQDQWVFSEGEAAFYHPRVLEDITALQEKLHQCGIDVNTYSMKLNEVI
jgi:hypothetical protein